MKPIILLDMDGVLANFHQGAFDLFSARMSEYDAPKPYNYDIHNWISRVKGYPISEKEMWFQINDASITKNFWFNLAPYDWYLELYNLCQLYGSRVVISSSPGLHYAAFGQKVEWLNNYLPMHSVSDIMLGSKKFLMANPGHILIDDSPENVQLFRDHGGKTILYPQLWNQHWMISHAEDKLIFVRQQLQMLTGELQNRN